MNNNDLSRGAVARRTLIDVGIVTLVGVVYYLVVRFTDFGLGCYIHDIFGINCPACGITRMLLAISRLDLKTAFSYNRFMFISLPYIVYEIVYMFYINESKKPMNKVNKIILYIWVGLFVLWGVVRNMLAM